MKQKKSNHSINKKKPVVNKVKNKTVKREQNPEHKKQVLAQREPIKEKLESIQYKEEVTTHQYVKTGIAGFDKLLEKGIPKGSSTIICGGPGSGKTIFCLQTLNYAASKGEKCMYMTFEESPERLKEHMHDFGWHPENHEKKGNLIIKKFSPFEVTRQVEAMLEQAKGELLIDIKPLLFPKEFKPDWIFVDSLSAIASAFIGKEDTYRIYIEQLFRLFEDMNATSFLISETVDVVTKFSSSGVEEFLADGVIVLYNIKHGNVRENAIEIVKIRGAGFDKKIVAIKIEDKKGIEVYPEQEVFSDIS